MLSLRLFASLPPKTMDEHSVIRKHFAPLAGLGGLDLLDDAALLSPPAGHDLVITTDTFVEGVHFPKGHYGGDTAERLMRTNLSDLAAKGARPIGYQLSLAWPKSVDPKWMAGFAVGLRDVQQSFDFHLLGGDTVAAEGPMVISATVFGVVPTGEMVRRDGANLGDDVWVTGVLGDAKLGCDLALNQTITPIPDPDDSWSFESAYWRPDIKLSLRKVLREKASAAADISDGIMADAAHICRASDLGMSLNFDAIPISNGAELWADGQENPEQARQSLLSFGDDYQILFTSDPNHRQAWFDIARKTGTKISLIGNVTSGDQVICLDVDGKEMAWPQRGYSHL